MHLASDYIHSYKDAGEVLRTAAYGSPPRRRARVSSCDLLGNTQLGYPGGSITNSTEGIAAGVIRADELPTPLVWIEHWPRESTGRGEETFELVVFSSYEISERAPTWGDASNGRVAGGEGELRGAPTRSASHP
jgi:hypothetical protein